MAKTDYSEDWATVFANVAHDFTDRAETAKKKLRDAKSERIRKRALGLPVDVEDRQVSDAEVRLTKWRGRAQAAREGYLRMTDEDTSDSDYSCEFNVLLKRAVKDRRVRYADPGPAIDVNDALSDEDIDFLDEVS